MNYREAVRGPDQFNISPKRRPTAAFVFVHRNSFNAACSVNPLALMRDTYREVAVSARTDFLEIEIICSDEIEHRKRVETRVSEVEGLTLPTWKDVTGLTYESWNREHLILDSSNLSTDECVLRIINVLPQ